MCLPDDIKVEAKFSTVSQSLGIVNYILCKHGNKSDCGNCEDSMDSELTPLKYFSEDNNNNVNDFLAKLKCENYQDQQNTLKYLEQDSAEDVKHYQESDANSSDGENSSDGGAQGE